MSEAMNPLIPAGYDIVWSLGVVAMLAITILALVSIARSAKGLTAIAMLVWSLLVIALPVVGAAVWVLAGRGPARRQLARPASA